MTPRHVEIILHLEERAFRDGRDIDPSEMSCNPFRHTTHGRTIGSFARSWTRDETDDWDRLDELTAMRYVEHRAKSTDTAFRLTDRGMALAHAARRWRIVSGGKANYDGFVKEWKVAP